MDATPIKVRFHGLCKQAQQGDEMAIEAIIRLVLTYGGELFRRIIRGWSNKPTGMTEVITSSVAFDLARNARLGKLKTPASLTSFWRMIAGYVRRALKNAWTALKFFGRHDGATRMPMPHADQLKDYAAMDPARDWPARQALIEVATDAAAELAKFNAVDRCIFDWYLNGVPTWLIAKKLGLTQEAVRKRISRIRQELRDIFKRRPGA